METEVAKSLNFKKVTTNGNVLNTKHVFLYSSYKYNVCIFLFVICEFFSIFSAFSMEESMPSVSCTS